MKILINKQRLLAVASAAIIASTAMGILPASAGLDEVIGEGVYTPPLAKEVTVEKTVIKPAKVEARLDMEYQVRTGDTLWSIAERSRTTVAKLAMANDLNQEEILAAGQTLTIPGSGGSSYHKIAAGETLSHIAGQYDLSVQRLIEANDLTNPDNIKVGQQLKIPAEVYRDTAVTTAGGKIQLGGWSWPAVGEVTSHFGIRGDSPHEGMDIGAGEGATISAAESGKVVWSGPRGTYGLTVIMDNGNGIRSLYAHCSKLLVQEGQRVERGQPIARVGNTGRSAGPHLHMEILRQGIPVDPLMFLKERLFG